MRRFRFKLETKLRLTIQEEKQMLWEYKTRQLEFYQEQDMLDALNRQLDHLWDYYRERARAGMGIDQLIVIQQYVPILKEHIQEQETRVEKARALMQEAEIAYLEKRLERKTINKLKEREYQLYMLDWQREEQKLIDEIAANSSGN